MTISGVESALEEVERQGSRSDKEHEDPDRPVSQAINDFVAFAKMWRTRVPGLDGMAHSHELLISVHNRSRKR